MTKPQRKMLEIIGKQTLEYVPIESNYKEKSRVCERLIMMGFVARYRHGGFIITKLGRDELAKAV